MQQETPLSTSALILRGLAGKCPHCGEGGMFRAFLKVRERCPVCGEELSHHRADDLPAYIVILLLGHIMVPIVALVEVTYSPPYWVHLLIWLPLCLILALVMLQPVKGAVVAVQWSLGLHGFAEAKKRRRLVTEKS